MSNELTTFNEAQRNLLTQSTPTNAIKQRKGRGGKVLSYVSHDWVTRQLNEAFNWAWSFEVVEFTMIPTSEPQEVIVKGRLTVITEKGQLVKEQFGGSDVKRLKTGDIISLADDLKSASSDCLKKCASLLGIALDLYGDGDTKIAPKQQRPVIDPDTGEVLNGGRLYDSLEEMLFEAHKANGITEDKAKNKLKAAGYNGFLKSKSAEMYNILIAQ